MVHEEYKRIVPGAKTAVLLMHGICGSPNHFRQVLPMEEEIPPDWSVYNLVLPGHCASVSDFTHGSMNQWKRYADAAFDALCRSHEKVILVAHSMGTLFAMDMANRRPEKVACLFLLASPLYVRVRLRLVGNLLRLSMGKPENWDPVVTAMRMATGMEVTWKLWQYIPWIPRVAELLRECKVARTRPLALKSSCIAFQSYYDEVVSLRSGRALEESGRVETHTLSQSAHYYYHPEDANRILSRFRTVLQSIGS